MNTALTLATNLRALMAERGLSPEELAHSCAMNLTTVQAALLGDGGSTLAHIDQLLGCLDVSLDDLLVDHHPGRQTDLLGGRAQLEQYWALPGDQRARLMPLKRHTVGRSQSARDSQRAGHPFCSRRSADGDEFLWHRLGALSGPNKRSRAVGYEMFDSIGPWHRRLHCGNPIFIWS